MLKISLCQCFYILLEVECAIIPWGTQGTCNPQYFYPAWFQQLYTDIPLKHLFCLLAPKPCLAGASHKVITLER